MMSALTEADEFELATEDEVVVEFDSDELLELDSVKLELLLSRASDDELTEEIAVDELLIDDEIATVDELTALLEPDPPPPLPPPPQAIRLQPRIPMTTGFIEEIIIKLSCVIVMVDYTISA
jgi:hypothetical protein